MKLPGISKIPNLLSLKTKNGWKEIQKNSSVAAQKGQNFILDNIRPLAANKDIKARWSISASQKPVNRPALPKKINVDFAKAVNNVWLHKTSGSMPLKGINDKLKGSLSGAKIANSFFQKINNAPDKERHAFQERVNVLLKRLENMEDAVDGLRNNAVNNTEKYNIEKRINLSPEENAIYNSIISEIESTRGRILGMLQDNNSPYQRESLFHKSGLSKNQYNANMRRLDDIEFHIKSKMQIAQKELDNLTKL